MNIFGMRLKQLREEAGWTKTYTAKILKLPLTTYANYEYGTREPDMNTITAISTLFNTSNDYLMGKTDNKSSGYKMLDFKDRLRLLREQKGWSKTDTAKKLKISPQRYANYEYQSREPDMDTLAKIAKILDTTVDYLAGKSDDPHPASFKSSDLDTMLDNARSFDGKPMNDTDREIIRTFLKGRFSK